MACPGLNERKSKKPMESGVVMTMNPLRNARIVAVASVVFCAVLSVSALYEVAEEGLWPKTWPGEFEPLRKQSRTLIHSSFAIYEIPFTFQKEFEAIWPHILKLKSKGAPVVLLNGSGKKLGRTMKTGIRIVAPLTGSLVVPSGARYPAGAEASIPDGGFLRIGPPWPEHIKSELGELPEYVLDDNGRWVAYVPDPKVEPTRYLRRARIDIELIVDGTIVDLNRIQLPADTPIIDKRFRKDSKK